MSAHEGQTAPSTINGHATGQSCPGAGGSMFPPGSQRARMISGRPYHQARDEVLVGQRMRSRPLIAKLEELPIDDEENRLFVMSQLFGSIDKTSPPWIEHGFRTDFGCNTTFGSDVYINYDCTILDCGPITIGNRVLFAPRVQLLGATHPLHYELRNGTKGAEFGLPITIEDDVWLGAGCMILGGVTVGRGAVVGAGAVVVRDVEPLCVVAGSPARVLRRLPEHATEEEKAAHTVTD